MLWREVAWRSAAVSWLSGLSQPQAAALAGVATACLAAWNLFAGPGAAFALLHLGPIAFAAWFASLPASVVLSLAGACAASAAHATTPAGSVLLAAWNVTLQLGVSLGLGLALASARERLQSERLLARTDALTLISNRRAFLELAGVELERARRTRCPITIAYLDCDDFKVVNDRMGHSQGDALLVTVAATLRSGTRAIDTVARLGGDEFGLLLVDTDGPTARALLERLRASLVAALVESGWIVTFSVGAVTFVAPPRSVEEMVLCADELMFAAKRGGKDLIRHEVLGHPTLLSSDQESA